MVSIILAGLVRINDNSYIKSDAYAMSKAMLLKSSKGSCSGEQIEAPSGQSYILTAAHCRVLSEDGISISVITEGGEKLQRKIIAEDINSDLLLLEGVPNLEGLQVARNIGKKDHVKTFTHGKGYPTYKTEGELVGSQYIAIGIGLLGSPGLDCFMPKFKIVPESYMGMTVNVCVLYVEEYISTAKIVPGSSGGMVLNEDNELIAVVSASGEDFSFFVPLAQIKEFIKGY